MEIKKSALYVVGTPIGNLADLSERAVETLKAVDFIAAEDTRVTAKLARKFGIKTPMISCREHNIRERGGEITARLLSGESCALVCDAGMPCVSDPGETLVGECREKGVEVYVVPGASAVIAALAAAGMYSARFCFEGFLSVGKKQRRAHLNALVNVRSTLIFYEAPHKLKTTLNDLYNAFGDREIAVCRELTKIHEEVIRGRLSDMIKRYGEEAPRGEFTLVVAGAAREVAASVTAEEAAEKAIGLTGEMKLSEAAGVVARQTGLKKSEIYKQAVMLMQK